MFRRRDRWAAALLLSLACLAAYANGLTGTFTYDDKAIVRDNPRIRAPGRVGELFSTSYFGGPRGSGTAYRPVLLLSYAAQWWVHGKDAAAFHAVNLILHVGATLLLAALFLRVGVPPPASFLAALFFAVAPVHVEAVTSLVGRGETLAGVFVLVFLHASLGLAEENGWSLLRRAALFAGALAAYALGILTKESAAVAPGLLFVLLAYRSPGGLATRFLSALRRGAFVYAGAAAVLGGTFALRGWVLGGMLRAPGWGIFEVENPLAALSRGARAANAALLLLRYAGRAIVPLQLSADESAWSVRMVPAASPLALIAIAILAAIAVLALWKLPSGSPVALGVLFFGVAFLPTANVLYPIGTIFGERIAYLPSAGLFLALGSALAGAAGSFSEMRRPALAAAISIAVLFGARTVIRNPAWWTDWSLFANSVATSPSSAKAHYNWAYICSEGGRTREARDHYARAVAIYAAYWDAWAGKGRMERELGMLSQAEASYRSALSANPGYENGFFGLGLVHEKQGRLAEAEAVYRRGLVKNGNSLPLAFRLASVLTEQEAPGAEAAWRRALVVGPDSAPTHADYADWLLDDGRPEEAAREARKALAIDPAQWTALRVLARRRGDEDASLAAALAFEKACRASRDRDDFDELARVAAAFPPYRPRYERVRGELERLVRR